MLHSNKKTNITYYPTCLSLRFLNRKPGIKNSSYIKTERGGETDEQLSRVLIYKGTNLQKGNTNLIFTQLLSRRTLWCMCAGGVGWGEITKGHIQLQQIISELSSRRMSSVIDLHFATVRFVVGPELNCLRQQVLHLSPSYKGCQS